MQYWEIIAHNLSKAGWSWGYVSAIDSNGRTIWIVTAILGPIKIAALGQTISCHQWLPVSELLRMNL